VEGRELHSVLLVSMGVYVLELVGLFVVPESIPILALATLLPLVFAAPYLDARPLAFACVAVGAVIIAFVVAGAILIVERGIGVDIRYALLALGTAAVTLLVLFLLQQSTRTASGLRDLALRDSLTGLHNRILFIDRLEHAMARAQRRAGSELGRPRTIAVVYLDVDGFKDINDRHGHAHGDAVLRAVAERLRQTTRAVDTVARIGGDEFAILVEELGDRSDVITLAERLMASMAGPIILPEGALSIRLSAGLAFSDDGGGTAESLLQNADHAMYHAKRTDPGEVLIYDPALRERSEERRRVKRALHGVVERNELEVHYQPLVRLNSGFAEYPGTFPPAGTIAAFEALVRWRDPERGLILPGEFIELAEETGDIMAIGHWVLDTACHQLRDWQRVAGRGGMSMLVNLSALELEQRGFGDGIREAIAASGITPHSLVLEITEHAVVRDVSRVRAVLDQLQGCGAHLVIDDFGTGYSSLSYLSSLPIDGLKIARPFVHDAAGDRRTVALLRAIVEVGAALGLVVVAEGIETRDELHLLRSLGCDLGQGHYLAPPMPADQAQDLVTGVVRPWAADLGRPAIAVGPGRGRRAATIAIDRGRDRSATIRG
jgi:diguanylate cyclase (GGDEF)-like protein